MAGELVLQTGFNKPYLLNDNNENELITRFVVRPSDEVRVELGKIDSTEGIDLCIVLDVSDSMYEYLDESEVVQTEEKSINEYGQEVTLCEGGRCKLDIAIDAALKVVDLVRPQDNISCIVYADNPNILFNNYAGNKKEAMKEHISKIHNFAIGKNTNISAAIREARTILVNNKDLKPKKILFLTDGVPTVDSKEDGIREGEYLAEYNISIEALGLGINVDLMHLEQIAAPSNGSATFITQEYDVEKLFIKIFEKTKSVIITDAKLKLSFSNSIRVREHYRGTPENVYLGKVKLGSDRTFVVNLGQIEKNQAYHYYFNIVVPAQEGYCGPLRIAKAELEYKIPALSGDEIIRVAQNVSLEFGPSERLASDRVGEIEIEYMLAEIKKLEQEAKAAMEARDDKLVSTRYRAIINTYENLGNIKEAEAYEELLQFYLKEHKIDLEILNKATNSSSKANSGGVLEDIEMPEYEALIGKTNGRR